MGILNPMVPASFTTLALEADEASINSALAVAPVTLAWAAAQKSALVEGIFNTLRQAPIAYTVGSTAYTWDARDEAVNALSLAALNALPAGVTTALATLTAAINSTLVTLEGGGSPGPLSAPSGGMGAVSWTPIGATAPVALAAADVANLIAAIAARRATLQGVRLTQQAAIAACTTVAQVAALAVSSGW